jgi:hypothetical protein
LESAVSLARAPSVAWDQPDLVMELRNDFGGTMIWVIPGPSPSRPLYDPQTIEPAAEVAIRRELSESKREIRYAYDEIGPSDPGRALRSIAGVWAKLDDALGLAEARSRLLLGRMKPPEELVELPPWAIAQFASLNADSGDEDSAVAHPLAEEYARRLLSACLAKLTDPNEVEAEVSHGPGGRVLVDWKLAPNRIQWMVGVSDLHWPGSLVNVLTKQVTGKEAIRETRTLHDAFAVVELFEARYHEFRQRGLAP